MRYTVLIGVVDLATGICGGGGGESPSGMCGGGGESIEYVCLPNAINEKWVELAQGGNLNVDDNLYKEYREALAAAAATKKGQCNASVDDLYWPAGSKKDQSDQGKKLLAGDRAGLADFQDWEAHPLSVVSGGCKNVCGTGAVPLRLVARNENFYNTAPGGDLTKPQRKACASIMAGFLNYYQTMPDCTMGDGWKIGIPDTLGVCVRKGTTFASNGTTVLRDGTWYKPPTCVSVRIIGEEESKPLVAPDSCKCCGDFEYHTPTSGVMVFAGGGMRSRDRNPPGGKGGKGGRGGNGRGGNGGRGGMNGGGRDDKDFQTEMKKKLCCLVNEFHQRGIERTVKDALAQCIGEQASEAECAKLTKATKKELMDYILGKGNNVSLKTQACQAWFKY